jgi:alpha-L-arabinofuranosidase
MIRTRLTLDRDRIVGELDRRIFGAFVEHVGR